MEELLLEEYKIGMDAYYRSEAIYATRENFFFVAMGITIAAVINSIVSPIKLLSDLNSIYYYNLIITLISLLGIILSWIWYEIQVKSFCLNDIRLKRLKKIEDELPGSSFSNHEEIFKFFTITNSEENCTQYMKTSKLRKCIPKIFLIFWIFIFLYWLFWIIIKL